MSGVLFYRGQQLGRNDLNLFLTNASDHPTQAAEIWYALYDFTTGFECLVGDERRTPLMPSLGEYYASVVIPTDARIGGYRVRWFFRETVGSPLQSVVQEFQVIDKNQFSPSVFSDTMTDLIRRLRILVRDNCLDGAETIEIVIDQDQKEITLEDLWDALHDLSPLPPS